MALRPNVSALAAGYSPYQQEAHVLLGLARSSAAHAVEILEAKAEVERDDAESLRIVDPLLGRWVRRHGATRQQFYVIPHDGAWV
jgi:hypothetical protein